MCKVPVLPDELQRSSRRQQHRGRNSSGGGGGLFRSFPSPLGQRRLSATTAAPSNTDRERPEEREDITPGTHDGGSGGIEEGVRLFSDVESDLDASATTPPQRPVITPDGSPSSTTSPGAALAKGRVGEAGPSRQDNENDIDPIVLEEGQLTAIEEDQQSDSSPTVLFDHSEN